MKSFTLICCILALSLVNKVEIHAQRLLGTTGLMNIPTADMKPAGTFDGGITFMQKGVTNDVYNFDTGIYYINFTPFNFLEFTFRETLLKTQHSVKKTMGYYQQDRSTTFRLRPLAEQPNRWWPSFVIGINDVYSAYGDSFYTGIYGSLTKHIPIGKQGSLAITTGYFHPFNSGKMYDGFYGGIEYSPFQSQWLNIMADYDSKGFNFGMACRFWKSLNVFCYTQECKGIAAGVSYQHTIKF